MSCHVMPFYDVHSDEKTWGKNLKLFNFCENSYKQIKLDLDFSSQKLLFVSVVSVNVLII